MGGGVGAESKAPACLLSFPLLSHTRLWVFLLFLDRMVLRFFSSLFLRQPLDLLPASCCSLLFSFSCPSLPSSSWPRGHFTGPPPSSRQKVGRGRAAALDESRSSFTGLLRESGIKGRPGMCRSGSPIASSCVMLARAISLGT